MESDDITTRESAPVSLVINEPIGRLSLSLCGGKITVEPARSFAHALAERMGRAERLIRERSPVLDIRAARSRISSGTMLNQFFGEFDVNACEVDLVGSRLHVKIMKVRTSFGPQTFSLHDAEVFVQQFNRARAGTC